MQKNQDLVVPFFKLQQTGENITAQGFIDRFDSNGYGVVNLNQKKQVRAYNFSGFATLTDENLEKQLLEDKNKLLRLNNVYSQKLHEAQKKNFANEDMSNLLSTVQDLQKEVSTIKQQNKDQQKENKDQQKEIKDQQKEIKDLQQEVKDLQQENIHLKQKIIDLQQENINLQQELHIFKSDVTVLKTGSLKSFAVKACAVCGASTRAKCSKCCQVYYCTPSCQKVHWDEHRKSCKEAIPETEIKVTFDHTYYRT